MKDKVLYLKANKALTMPILSFPSTQLIGCSVRELLEDSSKQAQGMKAIMDKCPLSASLNMMDLSVEAECFGAEIKFYDNEIPTVIKGAIDSLEDVGKLKTPKVGDCRTAIYIDGVKKAKALMPDKMIMCGVIGVFSLAGRLYDMTELMMSCYDEPELVHELLERITTFLIDYILAYKAVGADGVIMAEPAAGLLSPELCEQFSSRYIKRIFEAINSDDFVLIYHNCGNVIPLAEKIELVGADIYHFGNAINIGEIIPKMSSNVLIMGNVNPVNFRNATASEIANETKNILDECGKYDNFIISSGCDIPSDSNWDNIDAYFATVSRHYGG